MIGWWPGEGSAADIVGGNSGILTNGATFTSGAVGQAFSFPGRSSFVKIPKAPNLDPGAQVTIEFWMKADPTNAMTSYQGLVNSDFYGIEIANGYVLGPLGVNFFISTTSGATESFNDFPDTATPNGGGAVVSAGQWHHVAGTYDGTRLQLYIDGLPWGVPTPHTGAISPMLTNSFVSFGSEDGRTTCPSCIATRYFNGLIDEPTIYNRALSASEVLAIYNAGSAGKCAPSPGVPTIFSLSPTVGAPGTIVTISGANFSSVATNNIVYFGAVRANLATASATTLSVAVPIGATYAPVTVAVNGLVAWSSQIFEPTFHGNGSTIGANSLAASFNLGSGSGPGSALIADLDGDGKPDVAEANGNDNTVSIFRNTSATGTLTAASFAPRIDLVLPGTNGGLPYRLRAADLDGDGKLDLIVAGVYGTQITLFHNISTPGGTTIPLFDIPVALPAGNDCRFATAADLDGDGKAEIIALNFADSTVSVFKNIGSPGTLTASSFAPPINLISPVGPYEVAIGDINGDGKLDLALANYNASVISVFRNTTVLGVLNSNSFAARVDFPSQTHGHTIVIGDIDGDGKADLVAGFVEAQTVSVYRNIGSLGTFDTNSLAPSVDFSTPGWMHTLALADMSGDGKLDMIAVGELPSYLSIWQNLSTPGSFTSASLGLRTDFATGYNAWGVAAGDLDGDGRSDIVLCNAYDATLSVYQNIITPALAPAITAQPTNQTVVIGDRAIFSVTATGSPLAYQWLFNGAPLAGATSTSLTIFNVHSNVVGNYSVIVSNAAGTVVSSNATLSLLPSPNCVSIPSGLVSWWRGETNVLDDWDSNNATNPVKPYVAGKVGNAFAGITWAGVPDAPNLRLTNGLTIEAWIYPTILSSQLPRTILSKWDSPLNQTSNTQSSFYFGITNSGQLYFVISSGGPSRTNVVLRRLEPALPTNTWSHVAATYSGSNISLYVDGNLAATRSNYSGGMFPGTAPVGIGAIPAVSGYPDGYWPFNGYLDELSLYSRALSREELQAIYLAGSAGKCLRGPLIATQPQSQAIPQGEDVLFSVSAFGPKPLKYQWRFGRTNIVGATNSSYYIERVQSNVLGEYSVVVSNSIGFATSSNAVLTMLPPLPCTDPPAGIISWWPADGFSQDAISTNNANVGQLVPTLPYDLYATGKVARAFARSVLVPNSASLNFASNVNFSLEAWIKAPPTNVSTLPTIRTPSFITIFSKIVDRVGYQLVLTNGQLGFFIGMTPGTVASNSATFIAPTADLRDNRFHHVAVTANRTTTNGGNLYLDGQSVLTFDLNRLRGNLANTVTLTLGLSPGSGFGFSTPGLLDEAAIYGRALSAAEILAIRQAGAGGKCKVPPSLTLQPVSQTVTETSNVTFTASAVGTGLLRYQWTVGSSRPLPGATQSSLTLSNVQYTTPRLVSVLVTNVFGSVTSSNAVLTVNRLPIPRCAGVVNVPAAPDCKANASIDNGSYDPDGGSVTLTQTPPGPYPLGTNSVTLWVSDSLGASNFCTGLVVVLDSTPPSIVCPTDITVTNAHDAWTSVVTYSPVASDNCSGVGTPVCTPASGTAFGLGTTPVLCTVTDAAGNSTNCSFQVTVYPGNKPPVPIIQVAPLADFPANSNLIVIAANGSNTTVYFDGSKSYDPDDATFLYFWYAGTNLFGTSVVATNVLPLGTNQITLRLDDTFPLGTNSATLSVQVISPAMAVDMITALISNSSLAANRRQPLLASLNAASASFQRGNTTAGVNQIQAFENKVLAQISPTDPALAASLIQAAEQILKAFGQGSANVGTLAVSPKISAVRQTDGKVHVKFAGAATIHFIQASTNLVDWETIGVSADANFELEDVGARPNRFYRVTGD